MKSLCYAYYTRDGRLSSLGFRVQLLEEVTLYSLVVRLGDVPRLDHLARTRELAPQKLEIVRDA